VTNVPVQASLMNVAHLNEQQKLLVKSVVIFINRFCPFISFVQLYLFCNLAMQSVSAFSTSALFLFLLQRLNRKVSFFLIDRTQNFFGYSKLYITTLF